MYPQDNKMSRSEKGGKIPELYSIFHGEVASLQTYGAFIKIPGCKRQGLVHKSQMSNARIEDPAEMLAKGEMVHCKVIAMEGEGEKISLSMKVVNQTTGQDLDPNNVQLDQDAKKRRQWKHIGKDKIELGAELNTTCRRCGGHGHLTMDCFSGKDGTQYDLIPDIETLTELPPMIDLIQASHKKKKKKKEKKKKKKKRKKPSSSSDESTSSEEDDRADKSRRLNRDKRDKLSHHRDRTASGRKSKASPASDKGHRGRDRASSSYSSASDREDTSPPPRGVHGGRDRRRRADSEHGRDRDRSPAIVPTDSRDKKSDKSRDRATTRGDSHEGQVYKRDRDRGRDRGTTGRNDHSRSTCDSSSASPETAKRDRSRDYSRDHSRHDQALHHAGGGSRDSEHRSSEDKRLIKDRDVGEGRGWGRANSFDGSVADKNRQRVKDREAHRDRSHSRERSENGYSGGGGGHGGRKRRKSRSRSVSMDRGHKHTKHRIGRSKSRS